MTIRLQEYIRKDGSNPFSNWFNDLDPQAAAKVAIALLRVEMGNISNVKWFQGIGELKINWGPGYRVYLAQEGKTLIILFGGGTKKRQEADVDAAKKLFAEYKARKAAGKIHQDDTTSKPKR